jgi:cell division initiation protein
MQDRSTRRQSMNITPLDIRKHEFKKSFRGYEVDEVTGFLDMISMEYEQLLTRNMILQEKVQNYESQLKKYHDIEGTLQETLFSAERAREETLRNSKKQAEVIIREAEVRSASLLEDTRETISELRNAIMFLKVQKESYITKLKALANAQLEMFTRISFDAEEKMDTVDEIFIQAKNPAALAPEPAGKPGAELSDHDGEPDPQDEIITLLELKQKQAPAKPAKNGEAGSKNDPWNVFD